MEFNTPTDSIPARLRRMARLLANHDGNGARAMQTYGVCMQAIENCIWPGVAWSFSGLVPDGGPIEFCFSSKSNEFRFTTEVAGPELQNSCRLDAACELIQRLGHPLPPSRLLHEWRNLQAGHPLKWGAWLGVRSAWSTRQSPNQELAAGLEESVKLYLEIPSASTWQAALPVTIPGGRLLIIGYESGTGRTEYYFRKPQMNRNDFDMLLNILETPGQRKVLSNAVTDLCGLPIDAALRWLSPAYSVACLGTSTTNQLALFVRASNIGRSAVRQKMLASMTRFGNNRSAYQHLLEHLPANCLPEHSVITLTVANSDPVEMRVGMSGVALANLEQFTFDMA